MSSVRLVADDYFRDGMWYCPHCEFSTDKRGGICGHIWRKHTDVGQQHNPKQGKPGQNQYTTGKMVSPSEETRRKMSNNFKGRTHTEETKKKISERRIQYLTEHPDKVPYLLNHSFKVSYPEQYFRGIFEFEPNVHFEYRIGLYSLDVAFPLLKINIEIDGEQHYLDNKIIESDIRRNKYLSDLGWTIIRIRWSEYQRMDRDEKEMMITSIKHLLKQ